MTEPGCWDDLRMDTPTVPKLAARIVALGQKLETQQAELIALRRAVLGDMTAEEAAEMYRGAACAIPDWIDNGTGAHFNALADEVEAMKP